MVVYREVENFTDFVVIDYFMYLEREDPSTALTYLSQWDYGESLSEESLERQDIFEGLSFTRYAEDENYLALWQIGVDGITLYRKEEQENLGKELL